MWGILKFANEAPIQTAAKWIALNWIMQSQTKPRIAKSWRNLRLSEILHSEEW